MSQLCPCLSRDESVPWVYFCWPDWTCGAKLKALVTLACWEVADRLGPVGRLPLHRVGEILSLKHLFRFFSITLGSTHQNQGQNRGPAGPTLDRLLSPGFCFVCVCVNWIFHTKLLHAQTYSCVLPGFLDFCCVKFRKKTGVCLSLSLKPLGVRNPG